MNFERGNIVKIDDKVMLPLMDLSRSWTERVENSERLARIYREDLQRYDNFWINVNIQLDLERQAKEAREIQNETQQQI